jgi:small-conductance mechanosensitive channel
MGRPMINHVWTWLQTISLNFTWVEISFISFNLLFILGGEKIFKFFLRLIHLQDLLSNEQQDAPLFILVKRLNILGLVLVIFFTLIVPLSNHQLITQSISILLVISVSYFMDTFLHILIMRKFGVKKQNEDIKTFQETYRSRLMSLLSSIFIIIITMIIIIRILGLDSILETGGALGIIGVFLALTQASWAPDLMGGLVILNSGLMQEKDVIELSDQKFIGIVFKTKMFHTELLCLTNNNRVMMPNSTLRQSMIRNLSKFASAKGLRESLSFNIGYDVNQTKVNELFNECFKIAIQDNSIEILEQHPIEIRISAAGDYAIEWTIFYYIKDIRKVLSIRHSMLALITKQSAEKGISLATPVLYERVN